VSEEEYQEVYGFVGTKRKVNDTKKLKPKSNSNLYVHKHHQSEHPHTRNLQSSSAKVKEQLKSEQTINNQ
jgi:hypothetical protein